MTFDPAKEGRFSKRGNRNLISKFGKGKEKKRAFFKKSAKGDSAQLKKKDELGKREERGGEQGGVQKRYICKSASTEIKFLGQGRKRETNSQAERKEGVTGASKRDEQHLKKTRERSSGQRRETTHKKKYTRILEKKEWEYTPREKAQKRGFLSEEPDQ